jgi:Transposase DDE domain
MQDPKPFRFPSQNDRNPILFLEKIELSPQEIRSLAFASGFCQRSGKIDPHDFLVHLCLESTKGTVSFNDLAARIEADSGLCASPQAYWERMNDSCLLFLQGVLARALTAKHPLPRQLDGPFQRILLQDSTLIRLPARLFKIFSGVSNQAGPVCHARIQCVFDLVSGSFLKFSIDPYSKNDLLASFDLDVQPGDLVLRDRGYFNGPALAQQARLGAHWIYRYKHKTTLWDALTGDPIELLDLLKTSPLLDRPVLVGPQKFKARLLAAPVPEETANLRRMRAKKEMNGHAPSQELLALMSWSVFLTTIDDSAIGFPQVLRLYAIRWRIENIFKTWKSNFHFDKIHRVSEIQLRILLTARFMIISILYEKLFIPLAHRVRATSKRVLSLMKFMRYLSRNLNRLPDLINGSNPHGHAFQAILRYCVYAKRKRPHFIDQTDLILAEIRRSGGLT